MCAGHRIMGNKWGEIEGREVLDSPLVLVKIYNGYGIIPVPDAVIHSNKMKKRNRKWVTLSNHYRKQEREWLFQRNYKEVWRLSTAIS